MPAEIPTFDAVDRVVRASDCDYNNRMAQYQAEKALHGVDGDATLKAYRRLKEVSDRHMELISLRWFLELGGKDAEKGWARYHSKYPQDSFPANAGK